MENHEIFLESCVSQMCYKSCFCQGLFLKGSSTNGEAFHDAVPATDC